MDKSPSIIGRMFDRIAPDYDSLNTILSLSIDRAWRRTAISSLDIRADEAVLDIATGTGDMAILAFEQHSCKVTGIDLSRQMLVRALIKTRNNPNGSSFHALQGDALFMPFRNESLHKAMMAFGIRNVQDIDGLLKEVHRVLKADGQFCVLEFSLPHFPPFRWIYTAYLSWILPLVGGLISGDFAAYRYLRDSVKGFPLPGAVEMIMEKQGFRVMQSKPLFWGISHLYLVGKRP
jgi:demethylmenaquinone methyltransferase / 2-methoxy-6-polyprenyl-1,4-benzoquinol methylase